MQKRVEADRNLESGNYDIAIENYKFLLSESPGSWKLKTRLGFTYIKAGQYDNAIEVLNTIKNINGLPWAHYYLGYAYKYKKEHQKAIEHWSLFQNKSRPEVERLVKKEIEFQKNSSQYC